ncbi:hypothetical protein UFOVP935_10 [uncultured Caudovirales phage]|uniref:Uncharacterized protein n=1 Tax=uncultured Caudovirales phage TaxID=2100421 RepID=A0A6J5PR00_9CAUD|nr:hypothetical protein UFOVP935_10 [uncultured Caudovirales phage]
MRIPLAGDIESRDGTLAAGALLVNAAVQIEDDQNTCVFKRAGSVARGSVTAGDAQCLSSVSSKAVAVVGDHAFTLTVGPTITEDSDDDLAPIFPGLQVSAQESGQISNARMLVIKTTYEAWILTP